MRLSLARAFMHGKIVVIDSDLTSLDKGTRGKVLGNISEWVKNNGEAVVFIKGKKGDQQLEKVVDHWVRVQPKFSRVYL